MNETQIQERIGALRSQYGAVEALQLADGRLLAMRRPTPAEFIALAEVVFAVRAGADIGDPMNLYRPLLDLLIEGQEAVTPALLDEIPGLEADLQGMLQDLSGADAVVSAEAAEPHKAVAKKVLGFTVGGESVALRGLDKFEWIGWQRRDAGRRIAGARPFRSPSLLAELAREQVVETPDKEGKKAAYEALLAKNPGLGIDLGMELVNAADSGARRVRGK